MVTLADVVLPIPVNQAFTYQVPRRFHDGISELIRVRVPFGKTMRTGFIVRIKTVETAPARTKSLAEIIDKIPLISDTMYTLAKWVADYYLVPLGVVLPVLIPSVPGKKKDDDLSVIPTERHAVLLNDAPGKCSPGIKQAEFLDALRSRKGRAALRLLPGLSSQSLGSLVQDGLIRITDGPVSVESFGFGSVEPVSGVNLSEDQNAAFEQIVSCVKDKSHSTFLLQGVPGSGKTEVYIKLAEQAVAGGRTAVVLVPEIALTPQIAERFYQTFRDKVAVWHSNLTVSQRKKVWRYMFHGMVDVVVGARSAVFAPLKNVGVIIVDEEQEHTFKQEDPDPRYHARDVAVMRGSFERCPVVLGSATPSLESYFNQVSGKYTYLFLEKRYRDTIPPRIHIVNMINERDELDDHRVILSRLLRSKIAETLERDEQVILLQNRRGFSPVVFCRDCGYTERCANCNISLTYHKTTNSVQCHYCGIHRSAPYQCPKCQGIDIIYSGWGTQHIEDVVRQAVPGARIERMDLDSTRRSGQHVEILQRFRNGKVDILLGTQMIAKGLDFPNVTLVGVVDADMGLTLPEFRVRERVFQLLYQVSGRSGRGKKKGEVVIQTSNPDEFSIKMAVQQDWKRFYNRELADRGELNYPPFSRMVNIKFSGNDRETVNMTAKKAFNFLSMDKGRLRLIGPSPAPFERLRGQYRFQLIVKSSKKTDPSGKKLRSHLAGFRDSDYFRSLPKSVRVKFDVDPVSLL